jgi:hypothetical protein
MLDDDIEISSFTDNDSIDAQQTLFVEAQFAKRLKFSLPFSKMKQVSLTFSNFLWHTYFDPLIRLELQA